MANFEKSQRSRSVFSARSILATGCLIGASLLIGCGDSPVSQVNVEAAEAAELANRKIAGAGESHASDKLVNTKIEVSVDPVETDKNASKAGNTFGISGKLKLPDQDQAYATGAGAQAAGRTYEEALKPRVGTENERIVDDLAAITADLNKQVGKPELSKALKTTIDGQMGESALGRANIKLQELNAEVGHLGSLTARAMSLASEIVALDQVATAIEGGAKMEGIDGGLTAQNADQKRLTDDLKAAKDNLAALQNQKASLEQEGRDLDKKSEDETKTTMGMPVTTDAQKDAFNVSLASALKTYDTGAGKREEAAKLVPKISEAETKIKLVTMELEAANAGVKAFSAAKTTVGDSRTEAGRRSAVYRERMKGLAARPAGATTAAGKPQAPVLSEVMKEIDASNKKIKGLVAEALVHATDAQKSFAAAVSAISANQAKIDSMITDGVLKRKDDKNDNDEGTINAVKNRNNIAMINILSSYAAIDEGAALLADTQAFRSIAGITEKVEAAYKVTGGTMPPIADMPKDQAGAAKTAFTKAQTSAGTDQGVPLNWLQNSSKAASSFGLSFAEPDKAADHKKAAVGYAEAARGVNPLLEFPGLLEPVLQKMYKDANIPASSGTPTPAPTNPANPANPAPGAVDVPPSTSNPASTPATPPAGTPGTPDLPPNTPL